MLILNFCRMCRIRLFTAARNDVLLVKNKAVILLIKDYHDQFKGFTENKFVVLAPQGRHDHGFRARQLLE